VLPAEITRRIILKILYRPNSLGGSALSLYCMFAGRLQLQAKETSRIFRILAR
jgi:hypothetical protein